MLEGTKIVSKVLQDVEALLEVTKVQIGGKKSNSEEGSSDFETLGTGLSKGLLQAMRPLHKSPKKHVHQPHPPRHLVTWRHSKSSIDKRHLAKAKAKTKTTNHAITPQITINQTGMKNQSE